MKLSAIPVVKLPLVDVSTDPLDLLVAGLALRMKQLARTSPKFIELVHERQFRFQIGTDLGMARQIIVNNGHIGSIALQTRLSVSADVGNTSRGSWYFSISLTSSGMLSV